MIDDDADILRLMDHVLTHAHYLPTTATRWTEALDAVEHQDPDLLILDLVMPHVDGVALLRLLERKRLTAARHHRLCLPEHKGRRGSGPCLQTLSGHKPSQRD